MNSYKNLGGSSTEVKPKKIKNKNYRKFLDENVIDIIDYNQLKRALANVDGMNGKYIREGRALLIAMYYTGGRPVQCLNLVGKDIQKEGTYVTVQLAAAKRGLPVKIYLPMKFDAVKELYEYAVRVYPEQLLFYHYRNSYKRTVKYKSGKVVERIDISGKLSYHVKKWFKGVVEDSITSYFLRHNRFSQLSNSDVPLEVIRIMKGAKTLDSVVPYAHMSTKTAKDVSKKIK